MSDSVKHHLFKQPGDIEAKVGRDEKLEKRANAQLRKGVGRNARGEERDIEKMLFDAGLSPGGELYDPANDWDTHDSAFAICTDPSDLESIEASICDGSDGNTRARNPLMQKRKDLMRHVGDEDSWGPCGESIPLLGFNEITGGKMCTKCQLRKRLEYFSPDSRGKQGRDNWCKSCRMGQKREKRRLKD